MWLYKPTLSQNWHKSCLQKNVNSDIQVVSLLWKRQPRGFFTFFASSPSGMSNSPDPVGPVLQNLLMFSCQICQALQHTQRPPLLKIDSWIWNSLQKSFRVSASLIFTCFMSRCRLQWRTCHLLRWWLLTHIVVWLWFKINILSKLGILGQVVLHISCI